MHSSETMSTSAPIEDPVWKGPVDLSNCDREPVQFPGAIMPHGVLLVLASNDFRILGASANTADWFGCSAESLFHADLSQFVSAKNKQRWEEILALLTEPRPPRFLGNIRTLSQDQRFDVFAHRSGDVLILEFEAVPAISSEIWPTERFAEIKESIASLHSAETWQEAINIAVNELKRMSGFDSVVATRFLDDGSFQAVAEACDNDFPSYLDKRFPRSDIPEPGRRQMLMMRVQYAPDLTYSPVPIIMAGQTPKPLTLDLGFSMLRSISSMCNRYYNNMGVQSRLVFSLVEHDKLWGFFNCKNAAPKPVTYCDRLAFHSFAEMAALVLMEKEKAEQQWVALNSKRNIAKITDELASADELPTLLRRLPEQMLTVLEISGSALCLDNLIICSGKTPSESSIRSLMQWLEGQDEFFPTDRLPALFEPFALHGDCATGLIAARLIENGQYLLAFRPEWVEEVQWAGNPQKPVEFNVENGEYRLTPRGSFEVWKEDVRGKARPWLTHETEALADLQRAIILSQHAIRNQELKSQLELSNKELEDFAYIVSHDLQEPLRSIRNFSQFLLDNASERLEAQERRWLDTIMNMGVRMSRQIDVLLHYSRASQLKLDLHNVNINELLRSVIEDLSTRIALSQAKIEIQANLPSILCDPVRTAAVFENLITNAIKYNDSAVKRVEIGCLEGNPPTFFVRDNGIGIQQRHQQAIFTIFRRLHGREEYGGGNGAGLTIVRRHVERQRGRIWLESTIGVGTTFYFTLGS